MVTEIPLVSGKEVAKKGEPVKQGPPSKKISIPLVEAEEVIPAKISREPVGAKPVIPKEDHCCIGVCTHLNSEIEGLVQAISIRQDELKMMGRGGERIKTKRQIIALTNKVSALKDMRVTFKEKKVCGCIE